MRCNMVKWWAPVAVAVIGAWFLPGTVRAQTVADFEGLSYQPGLEYENGANMTGGGFNSGGMFFNNTFTDWGGGWTSWDGFGYSEVTDMATPGYLNEFSAYSQSYVDATSPGPGAGGSAAYAVSSVSEYGVFNGDPPPTIEIPPGRHVQSAKITNTTYAYLAIRYGNDGNDPPFVSGPFETGDFLKLSVTGHDAAGGEMGTIAYFLADFRAAGSRPDNGIKTDYILDDWTDLNDLQPLDALGQPVDITALAGSATLEFVLDTSDRMPIIDGGWANTPLYFAIDDVTLSAVPEPSTMMMVLAGAICLFLRLRRRTT